MLEAYAAARAARAITDDELERLRDSCRRYAELVTRGNPVELVQENR